MAASVSYELYNLRHRVFQPETIPETRHPPPRSVQIDLTITVELSFIRHDCITGFYTHSNTDPHFSQATLRLDLDLLKDQEMIHQVLAPTLTRLASINLPSIFSDIIIHRIIEQGLIKANSTSNRGRKILPLRAELTGSLVEHVNDQTFFIRRALAESASEFERNNYGMVPAKESSLKEMLKRVRVETGDDQDCMICLDELNVESYAFRMPCSHTFHDDCIKRWLKQSHYCPICRFEMPI
ncbi:hypothetical protein REPUB_Repub04eG0256000 [Reevesia pubescens]